MQEWDDYWQKAPKTHNRLYDRIAVFYRRHIIKPYLRRYFARYLDGKHLLLHAGCGSGQVEEGIIESRTVIGLDISPNALSIYHANHPGSGLIRGDIMATGFRNKTFDGIYNLGVMEHFGEGEILRILREYHRILKDDGVVILFWPPRYGATVIVLKGVHFGLNSVLRKNVQLHPAEPSLIRSKKQAGLFANAAGFRLVTYDFGVRDLFTYAVVVLKKA